MMSLCLLTGTTVATYAVSDAAAGETVAYAATGELQFIYEIN